jgi:ABC-type Fe3+-citrate transport system substrate-binding protein
MSVLVILLAVVMVAGCSGSGSNAGSKANSNVPDYYDEKLVVVSTDILPEVI